MDNQNSASLRDSARFTTRKPQNVDNEGFRVLRDLPGENPFSHSHKSFYTNECELAGFAPLKGGRESRKGGESLPPYPVIGRPIQANDQDILPKVLRGVTLSFLIVQGPTAGRRASSQDARADAGRGGVTRRRRR